MSSIRNLVGRSLNQALAGLGDQSGLATSSHEQTIENYQNISTLDNERFGNIREYFTSFLRSGYQEGISGDDIRTKISWAQSSCICKDILCEQTSSIDIIGVSQSDNGSTRGEVPIVFVDENGQDVPCLSHSKLPPIAELDIKGCSWDGFRSVHRCDGGKVQSLRFIDKKTGNEVARALNDTEIIPMLSRIDPDLTLESQINGPLLQIQESIVDFATTVSIPGTVFEFDLNFRQNIAPLLNSAKDELIVTIFDAFMGSLRPEDFPPERPASEAPAIDIIRMSEKFSKDRLLLSTYEFGNIANGTIYASPLHMNLKGQRPETSPPAENVSGIGILVISSCALGFVIGTIWRKRAFRTLFGLFSILTAFSVFIFEAVAHGMRWSSEIAQSSFQEAMVLVAVTGADRFDGLTPLGIGMDGRPFIVTTYIVELTDASMDVTWLFVLGSIISLLSMLSSIYLGKHHRWGELLEG